MIMADTPEDPLTRFRMRSSSEDVLWVLLPRFGGFDLLDLVSSHPDTRLTDSGTVTIVEVPVTALAELEEFGARLLIDPRRGPAVIGADVYLNSGGSELLLMRYDVELGHWGPAGRWLPVRVRQWERDLPQDDPGGKWEFRLSELVVDEQSSVFGRMPPGHGVRANEWRTDESRRVALSADLEQVLYRPTNRQAHIEPASGVWTRLVLLATNVILLGVVLVACIRSRRARLRGK
jgi:hypothetical protein